MNLSHIDRRWRVVAYIVLMAAGGVMVTLGVVTQELLDGIAPAIAGVLMVTTGGLAVSNVPQAHDDAPSAEEASELSTAALLAIIRELERLRQSPAESGEYQGQHRLGEG